MAAVVADTKILVKYHNPSVTTLLFHSYNNSKTRAEVYYDVNFIIIQPTSSPDFHSFSSLTECVLFKRNE